MSDALQFRAVRKAYGRRGPPALDGLTWRAPRGAIVGLVGANGAGKTTAFGVAAGYLQPDAGDVVVLGATGFDVWRLKGRFGILPQDAELPDRQSPRALLTHLARLQGLADPQRAAARVLAEVQLSDRLDAAVSTLSHGMRRRVAVATALLGEPELILLDEPMSGLDPAQAAHLREVLSSRRGRATLVVSSHDLVALERLCDHVVFLVGGRCVREGAVDAVAGRDEVARWTLSRPPDLARLIAAAPDASLRWDGQVLEQRARGGASLDAGALQLMAALAQEGTAVRAIQRGDGFEQRFFEQERGASRAVSRPASDR